MRGCRCIEIDVWNGDAQNIRPRSKSPAGEHLRRISASSLASAASQAIEDKYDAARNYVYQKSHSRSTSCNSRTLVDENSPKLSFLFPSETVDGSGLLDASHANRPRYRSPLPKGEPIVTHGRTLTAPCGFREVCEIIRDWGFVDNDLPIIISLEIHTDNEQQEVMVKIMKQVWEGLLVDKPHDGFDPRFRVPNLEDVMKKILIKVKRAPTSISSSVAKAGPTPAIYAEVDGPALSGNKSLHRSTKSAPASPALIQSATNGRDPICENLKELGVYTRSEKFEGFSTPQAKRPSHIFSVSENALLDLGLKQSEAMFLHNKNYFMRAYPNVVRVDSSNPDPSPFWRQGVQMVAMNWQYMDEGMMLNEGMFAGENGWILKPPGYQSASKGVTTKSGASASGTLDLSITIFLAQHIPTRSNGTDGEDAKLARALRPVIKAELHVDRPDVGKDPNFSEQSYKKKTSVKKTDHPVYGANGEVLRFMGIPAVVEDLGFVR